MPIDPQIEAMFANMPEWPPVRTVPIDQLRESMRQSSAAMPTPEVTLAAITDRTIAGPGGPLAIRIYTPQGTAPFPVVMFFHGGGWVIGDIDTHDAVTRSFAAGAGAIVISVDYRLAPEHRFPAGVNDCWAATVWAAEHAEDFGGDPARIAVAGDSAGGVLACVMAVLARDAGAPRLCAQVNFYGSCNYPSGTTESARMFAKSPILTADDIDYFWSLYLSDSAQQDDVRASPFRLANHAGVAPAFIATAEVDPSRDDTEAYAAKLEADGVKVVQHRYAGMVHGFVSWIGILPASGEAVADACAFLKQQFAEAA